MAVAVSWLNVVVLLLLPFLGLQAVGNPVVPETCPFCTSSCRNITVSQNGTDGHECLENTNESCHTLAYVLNNFNQTDCVRITVDYSHPFNESVYLASVSNLAIVGSGDPQPVLHCLTEGSGVSFTTSDNIWIENVAWEGCSLSHEMYPNKNATSALVFYQCFNITVTNCRFSYQRGSSIFMLDVGGNVHVTETNFTNNTTPMSCPTSSQECIHLGGGLLLALLSSEHCDNISFVISSCYFAYNGDDATCSTIQIGNALGLYIQNCSEGIFTIIGNWFEYNTYSCSMKTNNTYVQAVSTFALRHPSVRNTIVIDSNMYLHNIGITENEVPSALLLKGSALAISCAEETCSSNKMLVKGCHFVENLAFSGAVVVQSFPPGQTKRGEVVRFQDCYWHANTAKSTGAAVTLLGNSEEKYSAVFVNCIWEMNKITFDPSHQGQDVSLSDIQHHGVVVSEGIHLLFKGNIVFENNPTTALHLYLSVLNLTGNVTFANNKNTFGGAVYLHGAWIIPLDNLELNFIKNSASYGGAIYTTLQTPSLALSCTLQNPSSTSSCAIFVDKDGNKMCNQLPQNASISFINNTASVSGSAIYLNSRACELDCLHGEIFSYTLNDKNEISSPAIRMQFNKPAVCDTMKVMLGQNIFLDITTSTEVQEANYSNVTVPAVAVVTVYLDCGPHSQENAYSLEGPSALFLDNTPSFSNLKVKGPEIVNTSRDMQVQCTIHFVTTGSLPPLEQPLSLDLLPCKLGYIYDRESETCKCYDSDHMYCNEIESSLDLQVCIQYGYWYGKVLKDQYAVKSCPPGYCKYSYGGCPVGRCDAVPGFCKLHNGEDKQCYGKRGGVLCTGCIANHSFTFGAVKCVENSMCSTYVLVPVFLLLAFWSVMILAVLLLLKLNLRVGSGYLYAFIYYFSVVRYVTPDLPSEFLNIVLTIFVSVTNLNPVFIGEIPLCFIESMSSIEHQFFQYVHPLLISLAIFIAIVLARFCPRLPNPAKNSAIPAICILMLLSFSSLVETSFNLLDTVKFKEEAYVNIQADTVFFDPKKHLAFALIAILVLTLIIFPFMLLMFFSPLLMRCGVNLTKIKPILDEYQACYKDKWRWVAGFYFLCRIVVFSVSTVRISAYGNVYILQIFFWTTVVLHATVQPYVAQWLNLLDTVLLLDLALISMLYGNTADQLFTTNARIVRDILVHILILIPCFYFIIFVAYILVSRTRLQKCIHKYRQESKEMKDVTTQSVTFLSASGMTDDSVPSGTGTEYDDCDREPLLALLSDNGAPSAATYQAIQRQQLQESQISVAGGSRSDKYQTSQQWLSTDSEENDL